MGLILASAMRHSVGCPAMGMGGGTIELWSGLPPPSGPPLKQHREMAKSAPTGNADFVEINLMVRHKKRKGGVSNGQKFKRGVHLSSGQNQIYCHASV